MKNSFLSGQKGWTEPSNMNQQKGQEKRLHITITYFTKINNQVFQVDLIQIFFQHLSHNAVSAL